MEASAQDKSPSNTGFHNSTAVNSEGGSTSRNSLSSPEQDLLVTALNRASPSGEQHFQLRVQRKEGDETERDQVVQGLESLDFLLSAEGHLQASGAGGVACSKPDV